ncbi:unnamed protein product [Hermetia illucens]|uniref:Uncharacterized protein n=1 Tax=Hermetia illucens TaxID=343691 RepID=A0A7R8UNQ9_HERIL|nr:unnamed protein product [Hermetia illucens]
MASTFTLFTVIVSLLLYSLVNTSIIGPKKYNDQDENFALSSNIDRKSLDFVFPDSPLLINTTQIPSSFISSKFNISGNDSLYDEDDKIGGNAIITILG